MQESKLPITEHLVDLRKRIVIPLVSVLIGFIITFNFSDLLFEIVSFPMKSEVKLSTTDPYIRLTEKPSTPLVFLAPAEAFWMHMKLSFVASFILCLPVFFYNFWRFISPGLMSKEKKYFLPFMLSASLLFSIGALFCFIVVLPFAMTFLLGYKSADITPMISVGSYVDFCLKFVLAFGVVFELPLIIVFLTKFGIVSPSTLAKKRKYAMLLAFVVAALLTPTPDAFNQTLMAVPIILLYEIGILVSRIIYRKPQDA